MELHQVSIIIHILYGFLLRIDAVPIPGPCINEDCGHILLHHDLSDLNRRLPEHTHDDLASQQITSDQDESLNIAVGPCNGEDCGHQLMHHALGDNQLGDSHNHEWRENSNDEEDSHTFGPGGDDDFSHKVLMHAEDDDESYIQKEAKEREQQETERNEMLRAIKIVSKQEGVENQSEDHISDGMEKLEKIMSKIRYSKDL